MSKITINQAGEDTQMVIAQIQQDIEAEGLDITVGVNARDLIDLTGKKSHLANLCCTPEFMDRFFTGQTKKHIKALITD